MSEEGGGRRRGLARGLSALLGEDEGFSAGAAAGPTRLPIEFLRPSRFQPRRRFSDESLRELAGSIREKGVLQPLLVRRDPEIAGSYEIVAGERRWRAAQLAQLHELPVLVREIGDGEALELALVENVQRADLSPLEEAEGYKRLIDEFGHSQEALAGVVGKSRSHIANTLRLLNLPEGVKTMLEGGRLSAGHARALLAAPDPEAFADRVLADSMSVRETEAMVRERAPRRRPAPPPADADTQDIERRLGERLGLAVRLHHKGPGGRLDIRYANLDQLDDILRRLGGTD